ncbi:MAG: hypothetical protein EKK41_15685 [Hyphomicrobiales bacterium]|nr:MAG: hypothetical protein EKK41_15685 [Hyphomicrobiales bacterium]
MLTIGITGHRPNRLKRPLRDLSKDVRNVLRLLAASSSDSKAGALAHLKLISALAEGTDVLVARDALALGYHLAAIIPFARKDYEATFSDPGSVKKFRALWKAASERTKLRGKSKHAEIAYVAVGMLTVARSDILLAIWDGAPAQGRGGTPEIVAAAVHERMPVVWIHAAKTQAPRLIWSNVPTDQASTDLALLAGHAKPLSKTAIKEIVGACRAFTTAK